VLGIKIKTQFTWRKTNWTYSRPQNISKFIFE